jgi:CelD/BcsL family acetyltransferase involved in cellulose biosynthesis
MMLDHAASTVGDWDCIELQEIPEDSETSETLRSLSKESSGFQRRIINLCPYVLLPRRFEDCMQGLGSNFRKNLRRYERRLKKDFKVDFKVCNSISNVEHGMKTFFDLHQKRWQSKEQSGAFSDQKFCDFHLDVARSFAEKGWLTLNFLMLNDEPVAAGYDFTYREKLFYYLSGFDPQYAEYNVGHLRHMYLMKHCIEKGLKEYDFMRGGEPYKVKWNTSIRRNLEVRALKKRIIPIAYNWLTKNSRFSALTYKLGKHLSVR